MASQQSDICRMCLKDNENNQLINLRGNRDLKLKFFCCFAIAFSDNDKNGHLLCEPCIGKLNEFYQLKNHVQRVHTIFFGLAPVSKVEQVPACFPKVINPVTKIVDEAELNRKELEFKESLRKLGLDKSAADITDNSRISSQNTSSFFKNLSQQPPRCVQISRAMTTDDAPSASSSNTFFNIAEVSSNASMPTYLETVMIKNEPMTSEQALLPPMPVLPAALQQQQRQGGRGKQRGPVGRLIYKDPTTLRYPCIYCQKTFSSYQSIYIHIRHVHLKLMSCSCDICGKGFYSKSLLRSHLVTAHTEKETFKCTICNRELKTKSALSLHRMYVHFRKNSL